MSHPALLDSSFVYADAPFPSCHASTVVQLRNGNLLCAFFGGSKEGAPDVAIWATRHSQGKWGDLRKVADGDLRQSLPCWNPVLFQPSRGPLMLFYKVGKNPSTWWGEVKTSDDDGQTWSPATRLPPGILGPIKNKPVELPDGTIVSPTSVEGGDDIGWRVYFEISTDAGQTWRATPHVPADPDLMAIQPSLLIHPDGRLQAIGRTRKSWRLFQTWSHDRGETWSKLDLLDVPNPNSGTDAVTLRDGWHALAYNHSAVEKVRVPLNVALSQDGLTWKPTIVLENQGPDQFSYPAIIQSPDGLLHVTYTWKRQRIKHAVIDPAKL